MVERPGMSRSLGRSHGRILKRPNAVNARLRDLGHRPVGPASRSTDLLHIRVTARLRALGEALSRASGALMVKCDRREHGRRPGSEVFRGDLRAAGGVAGHFPHGPPPATTESGTREPHQPSQGRVHASPWIVPPSRGERSSIRAGLPVNRGFRAGGEAKPEHRRAFDCQRRGGAPQRAPTQDKISEEARCRRTRSCS